MKAASILTHITNALLVIVFSGLFISLCFFNNASLDINMGEQLLMAAVFFIILLVLYKAFCALQQHLANSKIMYRLSLTILFLCLFTMQLYLVRSISTTIGWDVWLIIDEAMADPPIYSWSLSRFPNNILLFYIIRELISVFRLIGFNDIWLGLSIVNVILVDLSLFLSIITIKKIIPPSQTSSHKALSLFVILFTLLIGLSPWLIVPYSDTFSAPVVSALILFCILAAQATTKEKQIVYVFICGLLLAVGWLIKPTIIAVAFAFLIVLLIYALSIGKTVKQRIPMAAIAFGILSFILTIAAFNLYVSRDKTLIIDTTIRTPMSYTIATGLVELPISNSERSLYGTWSQEVAGLNSGTTQEKNENYSTFIKEKLQEYGISGYLTFLVSKARWITSEGYFFWLLEGIPGDFSSPDANLMRSLLYITGSYYARWLHAANGIWIVVFLGCCLSMVYSALKPRAVFDVDLFIRLCAFFSIVVILFVEGRSRYLISFLPVFCMISAIGYSCLSLTCARITHYTTHRGKAQQT